MTLIKDNRTFTTDDENLLNAYIQNGWIPKKVETPLITEEKKPSPRKKSTK